MTPTLIKSVAAVLIAATLPASALAAVEAPELRQSRVYYNNGKFELAYRTIAPYRVKAGPALDVDFLMSASACRLAYKDFPAQGRAALTGLGRRYSPSSLKDGWPQRITDALNSCGQNLQRPTTTMAVAGTSGTFMEAFPLDLAAPADALASGAADRGARSSPSSQTLKSDRLSDVGVAGAALKGQVQAPAATNLQAGAMNRQ